MTRSPLHRHFLLAQTAVALALAAAPALAQDGDTASEVSELIVTAQKREQAVIDVPMAVTALSGARLEALGVAELDDLALITPGLEVQRQSPNNPGFVIRGISSAGLDAASEPRVSIFQDGVAIGKGEGAYVELFDLERVEVAKGPQSTLFGRAALNGAVHIIQKKASPKSFEARAALEAGSHDLRMVEAAVNVPLSDSLAVRLAGRSKRRDGYVDNLLGGDDFMSIHTDAARLSFAWRGDRADADLILNYQRDQPTGTSFKSGVILPADPATARVLGNLRRGGGAALAAPDDFEAGSRLGVDRTVWGATLLTSAELTDTLTLNATSAFRHYQSLEANDPDGTGLPILTAINGGSADQWSHEVRLNYKGDGRLSWFVGAGAFGFDGRHRTPIQFDERLMLATVTRQLNAAPVGTGLPVNTAAPFGVLTNSAFSAALLQGLVAAGSNNPATPSFDPQVTLTPAQALAIARNLRGDQRETAIDTADVTSFDVFADATYAVTDRLEMSLGVRFTHDDKTSGFAAFVPQGRSVLAGAIAASRLAASGAPAQVAQAQAILAALQSPNVHQAPSSLLPQFGFSFQPTVNNGDLQTAKAKDNGLTWRLVGRYMLNDDTRLYASYARGRRPEVLAATAPAAPFGPAQFTTVAAETVDSFELGLKGRALERRLSYDAAIYAYDYRNFETVFRDGARLVPGNAGKAFAYGLEAQADWAITSSFDVFTTYAYNHGRFRTGAFDGNHFRQAPDHSASVAASWRFDVLRGEVDVRPSFTWQSKSFFEDNNDRPELQQPPSSLVADLVQDEVQDAYGLVNLRIGYQPANSPMRFEVFGTNLTDKAHLIDAGNTGDVIGIPTFIAGAPRMVGIRFTLRTR
jgi:iron complex outermembrane receptor protein